MNISKFVLVCLFVVSAPLALAGKVVVFSPQAAIMGSEAAKKADEAMKADKNIVALLGKVENIQADMKSLTEDAKKNGMTWDANKQAEHRKKIDYLNDDYKLTMKKLQTEQKAFSEKLIRDMQPKLEKVLKALQEAEGIDIVLHRQAVVIASPTSDITPQVIEQLNKLQ